MAGILGIYGMIVAVIIVQRSKYTLTQLPLKSIVINQHMLILPLVFVVDSAL
jgi:hypothetical protein